MGANKLFEPKGDESIHPGVSDAAYNLLNDCVKQDIGILGIEYDGFVTDKENKSEADNKVIN